MKKNILNKNPAIVGFFLFLMVTLILGFVYFFKFNKIDKPKEIKSSKQEIRLTLKETISKLKKKYFAQKPKRFSEWGEGIIRKIDTDKKIIALTFDACGGPNGSGYDSELIEFLVENNIQSTLFFNARWIDKNLELSKKLASNPLFEIENHGFKHKPASVTGALAYGIRGTRNIKELVREIYLGTDKIEKLTGRRSLFYRSGTARYDNIAVKISYDLNQIPVNFNINSADADPNTSVGMMVKRILPKVIPGSIIIFHMNKPRHFTKETLEIVIPKLKAKGYTFVKLEEYRDFLK